MKILFKVATHPSGRAMPNSTLRTGIQKAFSNICPTRCNFTQFILSGNCSTCFGWYLHPSSEAQTTVSTASGICHTGMDRIKFTNEVYIKILIRLKLRLLLIMYVCGKCNMFCWIMNDVHTCNYYTDIQPKISIDEISLLWLFCGCWTRIWY